MRNKVQVAMIALLAVLSVYLIIAGKNRTDSLKNEIGTMNDKLARKDGECEEKLALLKAAAAREKDVTVAAGRPVPNLLAKLPVNPLQKRRETFEEMSALLKLSDNQKDEISVILADFRKQRGEVLGRPSNGKIPIFDPGLIGEINGKKEKALVRMKSVMTAEQYAMFTEKGYAERLGLKVFKAGQANR